MEKEISSFLVYYTRKDDISFSKDHIPVQLFCKGYLSRKFAENIMFPCILLRKIILPFRLKNKIIFLGKRNITLLITQERSYSRTIFFWKTTSPENLQNISYLDVFFLWERLSFIFRLTNKTIFNIKIDVIFRHNARKIIPVKFIGKNIFSGLWEKKTWFFVQWNYSFYFCDMCNE